MSRRSQIKNVFLKRGLSSDVFNLMVGMRGGTSRLALLQSLETPRHRQELAEVTGIDWKEVDRELGILEKYGLVKMYAQSGSVKLYQTTEQGGLLVKLIEELNNRK
jgi:predicted ArsR family transcriptional regulator